MAQALADTYAVHTVEVEHRGHFVPEGVGIDVGKVMPLAEPVQPCSDAIRVYGVLPVVLRKYKTLVLVVFAQAKPFFVLPCPIFAQEFYGFERQGDKGTTMADASLTSSP